MIILIKKKLKRFKKVKILLILLINSGKTFHREIFIKLNLRIRKAVKINKTYKSKVIRN
jgi:hypothetical protein